MKRNEVCYIAVVAVIGVSLLLGFAEEVFGLELGQLAWMALDCFVQQARRVLEKMQKENLIKISNTGRYAKYILY